MKHYLLLIFLIACCLLFFTGCDASAPNRQPTAAPWQDVPLPTETPPLTPTGYSISTPAPAAEVTANDRAPSAISGTPPAGIATSVLEVPQIVSPALDVPELVFLETIGLARSPITLWKNQADSNIGSGPDEENVYPELILGDYSYLQYTTEQTPNRICRLIFLHSKSDSYQVIADFDAADLDQRLNRIFGVPEPYPTPDLGCYPIGWGDTNRNNLPDLTVVLTWGDEIGESEVHIFELVSEDQVIHLTADLPGFISPSEFALDYPDLIVIDPTWMEHDCLQPPLEIFSIYSWRNNRYVDVTAEQDTAAYFEALINEIKANTGAPMQPLRDIPLLTRLLVMYEHVGQRPTGWQVYSELTNQANWPGTSKADLEWLISDVNHFARQFLAETPFTPNNYCR